MALTLLALALLAGDTLGVEYRGIDGNTRVTIPRVEASIVVDGLFDEPVWRLAARLTAFSQYTPDDGRPAEYATEVLVWYAPGAIHFGIRASAPAGTVKATLANRDKVTGDDLIEIFLDTYNDGRQALVFGVNPLGVQSDGALSEGASRGRETIGGREATDLSPDFVYASKGLLTGSGYDIEVRIPFKTLKYQTADIQDWRLNIVRRVSSAGHEYSWVPARRTSPTFLGQSGTIRGMSGLRRGLVLDLNPFVVARATGSPNGSEWAYDRAVEPGANVRWGVTPNLTLNGTVNPDFSQVESDAAQVVTDPRQASFFPEKRPFFLDGIEQFTTPNNLIYTRRIVAPVASAKVAGKAGGTNVAILLAADDQALSADGEHTPFFAVARIQRDLGKNSRAALVYTDRTESAVANRVIGGDARFVFGKVSLSGQLAGSATTPKDGETTWAPLWQLDLQRSARRFAFSYTFSGISDQFNAGAGFISRRGVVQLGLNHALSFYGKPAATLERVTFSFNLRGRWAYDDFINGNGLQDRQGFLGANLRLRGGWMLAGTGIVEKFGYDPNLYRDYAVERYENGAVVDTMIPYGPKDGIHNRDLSLTVESPRVGPLSFRVNYIFGHDDNFFEWSPAAVRIVNATMQLRPTSQLRLDGSYIQQWYQRLSDETVVGVTHIPRLKLEYQVTRSIFLRVVGEYVSQKRDSLRDDGRTNDPILIRDPADGVYKRSLALARETNSMRADWLFSYQPTPGTVFFLGYGGSYTEVNRFRFDGIARVNDGFFLKGSYLFRL